MTSEYVKLTLSKLKNNILQTIFFLIISLWESKEITRRKK